MKSFAITVTGLFSSLVMTMSAAASPAADALLDKIQKGYPNIGFTKVNETPAPGVFEAIFGTELLYVDATGQYFFPTMVNMVTQRNIGEERRAEINRIDFSGLPLGDAVKVVHGKGTRKMVVFADANCGYCKRLEANLSQIKDVTIYTFPLGILGADSVAKANAINCAKPENRAKMWTSMMIDGARPVVKECDNGLTEKNLALFKKHNFQGTPAIVFENGMSLKGFAENPRLEELLAMK